MSKKIPESYYIYKELLSKISAQRDDLKKKYLQKVNDLTDKVGFLKLKIEEQNKILKETKEYVRKLEEKMK